MQAPSFGNEVEQQGAQTCAQQGGGNAQAGEQRHQHRCAEHGKHVLHAQNEHAACAQLARVVNAFGVIDLSLMKFSASYRTRSPKKRHRRQQNGNALEIWEQ